MDESPAAFAFVRQAARRLVFWLAFFALARAGFFVVHAGAAAQAGWQDVARAFSHGLALDAATAAYTLWVFWLAAAVAAAGVATPANRALRAWEFSAVIVAAFVAAGDAAVWGEWGVKLSYRALLYLQRPGEVYASAPPSVFWSGLLFACALAAVGIWIWRRLVWGAGPAPLPRRWPSAAILAVSAAAITVLMRGGLQANPIRQSDAYFSASDFLNQAAVNPVWNLAQSVKLGLASRASARYRFFDDRTAERLAAALTPGPASPPGPGWLTEARPNIVLVGLESWSASLVGCLGGRDGLTPGFDRLAAEGILFERHFATGTLTHHGVGALLSGIPATPLPGWVSDPEHYPRLPHLARALGATGYASAFVFGGELAYGNIKAYLRHGGFDRLVEGADFDARVARGRLGVHDADLYDRMLAEADGLREPFFVAGLTSSTHTPYDITGALADGSDGTSRMHAAMRYADRSLAAFVEGARRRPWFARTVFVFVADHPMRDLRDAPRETGASRRVPLLLFGEPLQPGMRGYRHTGIVAQYDVPALLLGQLGLPREAFRWSRDPAATGGRTIATFHVEDGLGWVGRDGEGVFRASGGEAGAPAPPEVKALLQVLARAYERGGTGR